MLIRLLLLHSSLEVTPLRTAYLSESLSGNFKKKVMDLINTRGQKKDQGWKTCPYACGMKMEDITEAKAGEYCKRFSVLTVIPVIPLQMGKYRYSMTSMFVPEPVIHLSIVPKDNKARINMVPRL